MRKVPSASKDFGKLSIFEVFGRYVAARGVLCKFYQMLVMGVSINWIALGSTTIA